MNAPPGGRRPRLLDLFCGEGGAARGYQEAGFYVVGIDVKPQPRYSGDEFVQADAVEVLSDERFLSTFAAVHASPPCEDHSVTMAFGFTDRGTGHLLPHAITHLRASGLHWVVENVESGAVRAHMPGAFRLCGSMFGLGANDSHGNYRVLKRHRLFLASFPVSGIPGCACKGRLVGGVYGHGEQGVNGGRGYGFAAGGAREALGMPWASRDGCAEAIPPAYTRFIGEQLVRTLSGYCRTSGIAVG